MTTLRVPSIDIRVDTVVLGGTIAGMVCALRQAEAGRRVLLVEQGTCLYREMDQTADYVVSLSAGDAWAGRLFPADCMAAPGLAHPDRLKRHGEALCAAAGVELLYAAQALSWNDGQLLLAHKSGLYGVPCQSVFDLREEELSGPRRFCLHVLGVGAPLPYSFAEGRVTAGPGGAGHGVLSFPWEDGDEKSPAGRQAVYAAALDVFRALRTEPGFEEITLARSGFACAPAQGLNIEACVAAGLSAREGWHAPAGGEALGTPLYHANPLYPARTARDFPLAVAERWQGDVLIAGGGTAGAIAAYSAAKQGLRVRLLEMNEMLGGTATCGGVSIYWFGTRDGATALVDARVDALYRMLGLPRARCLWNENDVFLPDLKAHALLGMCLEAGVDIVFGATGCAVTMEGSHRVTGVAYAQRGRLCLAGAAMVIDATGDADLAMLAGARHTYGGQDNALTYWGSLAQYTSPGDYRNNFSTMVHVGSPLDYTRFIIAGRKRGEAMYDHGRYVALRESRHIQGLETVTLDALLRGEPAEDVLYQCFSNYDPKGKLTADLVYAGFLPPNLRMDVPRGAVIPTAGDERAIEGLLVGGKAVSCTHDALPGLRMQPDLQQQGFALGILAAQAVRQGVPASAATGIAEEIAREGGQAVLPLEDPAPRTLAEAIDALTGEETMEWLDMDPAAAVRGQPPVLRCFLAEGAEAVPLLRAALQRPDNTAARRLLLSRLLLWHREEEGMPCVLEAIEGMLRETNGLPARKGPTTFGQLLPDHGLMPEMVYLLNVLAWGKTTPALPVFEEVLRRLTGMTRDYTDLRAGIYCYVESFAYVAMRRGEMGFLPLLRALLNLPEFAGGEEGNPLLAERFAMLRLTMAEAMARLGDEQGFALLEALQVHPVLPIGESARMVLSGLQPAPAIQPVKRRVF